MQDSSRAPLNDSLVTSPAAKKISAAQPGKISTAVHVKKDSVVNPAPHHTISGVAMLKKDTVSFSSGTGKTTTVNFFGDHELKVMHNGPQSLNRNSPDWIFPLLVLMIAAFAWLRAYYNKYFMQIISAFFNNNLTNQIVRDENILVQRATILLNIVFNLVGALFLYFISVRFRWPLFGIGTGFNRYIFFALVVSAVYTGKFLVLKICGYLFNLDKEMAAYIFNIFLINNVLGILLIPVVAVLAFSPAFSMSWMVYGSLCLVGLAFFYRLIRGVSVGFSSPVFSLCYLFLYLCTLEFAPVVVLIKILNQK